MRRAVLLIILAACGRLGFEDARSRTPPGDCLLVLDPGAPRLNFHSQRQIQSKRGTQPIEFEIAGPATIDPTGVVTAAGDPGTATIKATDAGGCTASTTLTIGGDSLWYAGGTANGVASSQVWTSGDGLTWTLAGNLPDKRSNGALLGFHDRLWWISGSDGIGPRDEVWSSPDGAVWTLAGHSPIAAISFASVVFDGQMWMIGGTAGADVKTVYASDDGATWSLVGMLPDDSHGGSATVARGKLWYLGGHNGLSGTVYNWVLSSTTGVTWQQTGTMATGRQYAAAIEMQGTIVLAGGVDTSVGMTTSVVTTTNGTTFVPWTPLPNARAYGQMVLFGGRAWAMGGNDGGAVFSGVPGMPWVTTTTSFPVPRESGGVVAFTPL